MNDCVSYDIPASCSDYCVSICCCMPCHANRLLQTVYRRGPVNPTTMGRLHNINPIKNRWNICKSNRSQPFRISSIIFAISRSLCSSSFNIEDAVHVVRESEPILYWMVISLSRIWWKDILACHFGWAEPSCTPGWRETLSAISIGSRVLLFSLSAFLKNRRRPTNMGHFAKILNRRHLPVIIVTSLDTLVLYSIHT